MLYIYISKQTKINVMIQELKNINGTKGQESLNYFGTYRGIEWNLQGERSGNKVWWYLTDNEGENPMPSPLGLKKTSKIMKDNIDYQFNN